MSDYSKFEVRLEFEKHPHKLIRQAVTTFNVCQTLFEKCEKKVKEIFKKMCERIMEMLCKCVIGVLKIVTIGEVNVHNSLSTWDDASLISFPSWGKPYDFLINLVLIFFLMNNRKLKYNYN